MRNLLSIIVFSFFFLPDSIAQSLAINTNGNTADASALLDVQSTSKGMLVPRMSKAEKNAIPAPATGLLIFQNGPDSIGFYYYSGSAWTWIGNSSNNWSITGNSGTVPATHFVGTVDNNTLVFKTNNLERMRLTTNNELGIGTTTPNSTYGFAKVEIASEGFLVPTDLLIRNAVNNAGYAPGLVLQHARGTLAAPLAVANGDYLSTITAMNHDGTNYLVNAAIDLYADGAVSTGIVPTRMQFNTMNTAGSYTARLIIKNDGKIGIATASPATTLDVNGNFKLGTAGTAHNALLTATANIDLPSIPANSEADITATVTGASTTGSSVSVSPAADIETGLVISWARVSAANTVKIRVRNNTGSVIDPAAVNYVISVLQ